MTVEILHCDCMEYMAGCADKSFDLAVVDPPYGIGESNSDFESRCVSSQKWKTARFITKYNRKNWDNEPPAEEYFQQLNRVSKDQIIWGGNYFIDHLRKTPCFIVWDKLNGGSDFADCELAWTSYKSATRKFTWLWNGFQKQTPEKRIHPTQKPIALYRWIFQHYAKPGQRILDTHLGSGSSAIAAHYAGLDFVGCELDQEYFDAATKRFKEETRQMSLFKPEKVRTKHKQDKLI